MSTFRPTASAGPSSANSSSSLLSFTANPTARRAFTPPLFGQFGKKSKDLFKKKYDFDHTVKIVNKTAGGATLESSAILPPQGGSLRGLFKTVLPVRSLGVLNGTVENEFHTDASKLSITSYKFTRLATGLSVKVAMNAQKADPKTNPEFAEGYANVEAEYAQEYFAGTLGVRTDTKKTLIDATAALGSDNLSVGGKLVFNKDAPDNNTKYDGNIGVQIDGADYSLTGVTEKNRETITLSYYQSVGKGHYVGAQASSSLSKGTRALTFGTDYQVDVDTTLRAYAKVDSKSGDSTTVAAAVEHRLLNPQVLIGVAAEFAASASNVTVNKVGVSLTFGDY